MRVLLTGAAGFIGYHFANAFCAANPTAQVVGIDNLNTYYDVTLKHKRLQLLGAFPNFSFEKMALEDTAAIAGLFQRLKPDYVVHLGAQAGVRYSLENPQAYIDSNITGTLNILEGCRHHTVKHLIYASSSSVYGLNTERPFVETQKADSPASLYGATKKANEGMAHSYSHLFGIPATGLRFFTVYGAWGRPDMVFFKFTKGILEGTPIEVYNNGQMIRDFTFVGDVVESMVRLLPKPPQTTPSHAIYNIGNSQPVLLLDYLEKLQTALNKKAVINFLPLQAGDVLATQADTAGLEALTGYKPQTSIEDGIKVFVDWYKSYYTI
jgi:UDP-glucuronate 4-epimerase